MKTLLSILLLTITASAQQYLVLTQAQFDIANNWLAEQNGWPDGKGTERYAVPFEFAQFENCPGPLKSRVGLILDRAMIRHCRLEGETKADAIIRIGTILRNRVNNPTVVRVVPEGGEIDGPQTATFTDATATVVAHLREIATR